MIKYIIDLLKDESGNIFVNNFGLFEKKLTPAQMKDGILLPPQHKLFFNPDEDGNGFAFILKYAEREKKRLNDANAEISAWVEELKNNLQRNKSIQLEEFGTFFLNEKGKICFESAFIKEFNLDFEGMSPVEVEKPLKKCNAEELLLMNRLMQRAEKKEEKILPPEETLVIEKEKEEKILPHEETLVIEKEKEEKTLPPEETSVQEEVKPKKKGGWFIIFLIFLLLGIGGACYCLYIGNGTDGCITFFKKISSIEFWQKSNAGNDLKTIDELEEFEAFIEDDYLEEPINDDDEIQNSKTTVVVEPQQPPVNKPAITQSKKYPVVEFVKGNYYLIAGSLPTEEGAIQHVKNLKLDKFNPQLVKQQGVHNFRVSIGTFESEEKAMVFANTLQIKTWVLK